MSNLEWHENSLPVSRQFDDPYYSIEGGRAETDHVFIEGNCLPHRWPKMKHCSIAELGFGTGLNFLETVRYWQQVRKREQSLHFISFEQFPLHQTDMARALSAWPELGETATRLCALWDPTTSLLEVTFTTDIQLSVYMHDANTILPNLSIKADAWYLDGFSPAKNPELWNPDLMLEVGKHTLPGGTFATYTAAGFVRRNLIKAGFDVSREKGFGRKREMLRGIRNEHH